MLITASARVLVTFKAFEACAVAGEFQNMKILVACEFSGVVRDAFSRRGHNAWSCDLLPSETPGQHIQKDIFNAEGVWDLPLDFDLIIAHPPCTHLAVSGARWFKSKQVEQRHAIWFFMAMINSPAPKVCVENPVSIMSSEFRKPDQIIQPWQFGHGETKATCLWIKCLPLLKPSNIVDGRAANVHRMPPGPDRWKNRSRTFLGIAEAMADQWG